MALRPDSSRCNVAPSARTADAAIGLAENTGVVAATQAAVGAQHQEHAVLDLLALLQQRMRDVAGGGAEVGGQFGDLARVGLGLGGAVHRPLEARRGNQFHRPRDLADVADGLTPFDEFASLRHALLRGEPGA